MPRIRERRFLSYVTSIDEVQEIDHGACRTRTGDLLLAKDSQAQDARARNDTPGHERPANRLQGQLSLWSAEEPIARADVAVSYPRLPASAPVNEAVQAREIGGLSEADIARATGAARTTARAWLAGRRFPAGEHAERLAELLALVERLADVIPPRFIRSWMRKPLRELDDDKPLDVIAAGDYRSVARMIRVLESQHES
ncbi:MAG: helix-turn-helix transcriptional regulator [Actinomycetota bacterium]|nr:helix-turn-helix transcriptional regulator [Actinomycetota bacterium]